MPGAARFLYGVALGLSLGIIGVRLFGAASAGAPRGRPRGGLRVAVRAGKRDATTVPTRR